MLKKIQSADARSGRFYHQYESKKCSNRTLYFIGPYTGRKFYYWPFLYLMEWRGYRVVYLQPITAVLDAMHPEWLEQAIVQAQDIIYDDRKSVARQSDYLLGVSLGSYIGLNVILTERFKRFAVVAGGAPLAGIFRAHYLFASQRRRLKKRGGYEHVDKHWQKFDEAFKKHQLDDLEVLGLNSTADRMITRQKLESFMKDLTDAGAKVDSRLNGLLPHELQAFSLNWRVGTVDRFFKS